MIIIVILYYIVDLQLTPPPEPVLPPEHRAADRRHELPTQKLPAGLLGHRGPRRLGVHDVREGGVRDGGGEILLLLLLLL